MPETSGRDKHQNKCRNRRRDKWSGQTPEQTPAQIPKQMPEQTPAQMPEQTPAQIPEQMTGQVAGTDTGTCSRPPASPDTMSAARAEGPLAAGVRTVCRAPEACAGHRSRHAAKRLRQVRKVAPSPVPEAPRKDHREDRLPTVRCGTAPSPGAPQRENGSRRRISALRPERTYDPAAETARQTYMTKVHDKTVL